MNFHRMTFHIKYDNELKKKNENTIKIIIIYCVHILVCFAFDYCDLLIHCDL